MSTSGSLLITEKNGTAQVFILATSDGNEFAEMVSKALLLAGKRLHDQLGRVRACLDPSSLLEDLGIKAPLWLPNVASMIVAVEPDELVVVPEAFADEMTDDCGRDKPWRLIVAGDRWELFDPAGKRVLRVGRFAKTLEGFIEALGARLP
jgi:hypothetical protein